MSDLSSSFERGCCLDGFTGVSAAPIAPLGKPEPATPSRPSGRVSTDAVERYRCALQKIAGGQYPSYAQLIALTALAQPHPSHDVAVEDDPDYRLICRRCNATDLNSVFGKLMDRCPKAAAAVTKAREAKIMTDDQIKHMVSRFLMWRLPENFAPDGGISFDPLGNKGTPHEYRREPVGTNLLTYTQAEAMVRHMLADI